MADECLPTSSTASSEEIDIDSLSVDETDSSSKSKKIKLNDETECLEERLHVILCCAVCLDLPNSVAYQCRNGHLMCSQCFNHLLADAHLRQTPAVCPSCRAPISRDSCVRNLVVEKAISELPMKCKDCLTKFPRALQDAHKTHVCLERHTTCCYYRIGCPWSGPFKKKAEHEKRCAQPQKTGSEIKQAISQSSLQSKTRTEKYLVDYLSFEKVHYKDLKLVGPYHTDGYFIHFETFRFEAFDMQWEVRAYVNNNEPDPTLSSERTLSYQLLLKESVDRTIHIHYTIVNSPSGEMKLHPRVEEFQFSSKTPESHFALLPLKDSTECYRLLSGTITFRLVMFWKDSEVCC